jgi:hypothetical protein
VRTWQQSKWRMQSTPIIEKVIADNKGKSLKEIRRALRDAYPFGERRYHPYKIWLDECQRQLGLKWPIGHKVAWSNAKAKREKEQRKYQEWQELYG